MRKFFVLLRVSLQSMLHTFSFGRGKKRAATGAGAMVLLGVLALYLSGVYSFIIAQGLQSQNLLQFLIPLMSILACLMALTFTLFGANSVVFGNKDSDLLLALPVSAFTVMLSKILALYLENLLFCGLWMLPTCIAYAIYAGSVPISFYVCALICIPFLPLLPTLIGVLLGYCMAFCSAHLPRKALVGTVLQFVLLGGVIVGSMQISRLSQLLVANADVLARLLKTWLLPFGLLQRSIAEGNILIAFAFCVLCLVPFLAVAYLLSRQYKHILSSLASHSLRSDYKMTRAAARGQFHTLFQKEAGRYFGTTIYFFNTGFGLIFLLLGVIYLCFAQGKLLGMLNMMGPAIHATLVPLICAGLCLVVSTANTTCVSISLEGKTLWILKEAPISPAIFFGAKALLNFVLSWSVTAVSLIVLAVVLSLPLASTLLTLLLLTALIAHIALSGLVLNLLLPKLDAASDILVVKQSASSMCGILGGMVQVGVFIALYFIIGVQIGFMAYIAVVTVLLAAFVVLEWRWLMRSGAKRLIAL